MWLQWCAVMYKAGNMSEMMCAIHSAYYTGRTKQEEVEGIYSCGRFIIRRVRVPARKRRSFLVELLVNRLDSNCLTKKERHHFLIVNQHKHNVHSKNAIESKESDRNRWPLNVENLETKTT